MLFLGNCILLSFRGRGFLRIPFIRGDFNSVAIVLFNLGLFIVLWLAPLLSGFIIFTFFFPLRTVASDLFVFDLGSLLDAPD